MSFHFELVHQAEEGFCIGQQLAACGIATVPAAGILQVVFEFSLQIKFHLELKNVKKAI